MKRKIALLLSVILAVSVTGCGKKSLSEMNATENTTVDSKVKYEELKPEEGAKLVYWTADTEFGKKMAEQFEAKYGVPVTVEEVGMGANDKISLDGPTGKGADVFMCAHDTFSQAMNSGILRELDPVFVNYLKDRVDEVGIKTVTRDDKIYGVPVSMETSCLFYNKDLVGDKPATTLEDIMKEAKTFNDKSANKFELLFTVGDGYKCYPFLASAGFSLFGKDGQDEDPGFDSDSFEKGLELVKKLKETMPISSTDLGNLTSIKSQFCDGKAAYLITGPWDIDAIKKSGVNFGVTTLPTYEGKPLTPFAGVQNAHVSAYTKYPIAAQLLATYLVSDDAAKELYGLAGKFTTVKSIGEMDEFKNDEVLKAFVKEFEYAYPMPNNVRISYFWTVSKAVAQAVFDGDLSPKEGREKAAKDYKALVDSE